MPPSPAKRRQRESKKKALICLDSLGGNEPFQRVALTPRPKKFISLLSSPAALAAAPVHSAIQRSCHDFRFP
jgi:hypothetical protein